MVFTTSHKLGSMTPQIHNNYYLANSHCNVKRADIQE